MYIKDAYLFTSRYDTPRPINILTEKLSVKDYIEGDIVPIDKTCDEMNRVF